MIPYHLDEHVPRAIADGLRRRGINASTTVKAGLRSATDEAHLAYAQAQGRVMVTCDRDFLVLASRGQSHAGIVYYPFGWVSGRGSHSPVGAPVGATLSGRHVKPRGISLIGCLSSVPAMPLLCTRLDIAFSQVVRAVIEETDGPRELPTPQLPG